MFSMFKIKAQKQNGISFYENHLGANDYYSEKEKVEGVWKGSLSKEFNLQNEKVESKIFSMFQQNINPATKEKLTLRTRKGGIRFYDFQCSAQKSVSVMALVGRDNRLIEAHRKAVDIAMLELEKFACVRERRGENAWTTKARHTGNIVYSQYHHDASRMLDPQLHTHNVVCNVTQDLETDSLKALETLEMCKAIRYAGKVYQSQMALKCRELGYDITLTKDAKGRIKGFELNCVTPEMLEAYSKRRKQIDAAIEAFKDKKGRKPTIEEINIITRETRDSKLTEISTVEVRQKQKATLSPEEFKMLQQERMKALAKTKDNEIQLKPQTAMNRAEKMLFERESALREDKLLAEALNQGLGKVDLESIKKEYASRGDIKQLEDVFNPYLSKQNIIDMEMRMLDKIDESKNTLLPLNPDFTPFTNVKDSYDHTEQIEAIHSMLNSKDRFILFRCVAGAGKTSTLKEFVNGLQRNGHHYIKVIAPTNSAVAVLQNEGFGYSETVAKFLSGEAPTKSILIVDEAGLNSVRQGAQIVNMALKNDCRVVFVGDAKQHTSVEAGDFFRLVQEYSSIEKIELTSIYRQQVERYREGIQAAAKGDTDMAFHIFDQSGWIKEGGNKYLDKAAEDFVKFTDNGTDISKCLAVAQTHEECDIFTENIRKKLKEVSILPEQSQETEFFRSFKWTKAQMKSIKNFSPGMSIMANRNIKGLASAGEVAVIKNIDEKGYLCLDNGKKIYLKSHCENFEVGILKKMDISQGDIIQFTANDKSKGIINGQRAKLTEKQGVYELVKEKKKGQEKDEPKFIHIDDNFKAFKQGWVVTSHSSQGMTYDNVIVAAEDLGKKAAYVGMSRGRENMRLHCPDKEHLRKRLKVRDEDRVSPIDVTGRKESTGDIKIESGPKSMPPKNDKKKQLMEQMKVEERRKSKALRRAMNIAKRARKNLTIALKNKLMKNRILNKIRGREYAERSR